MKSILCIIALSVFLSGCQRKEKEYIPVEQVIQLENGTITHKCLVPNPMKEGK